MPKQPPYEYGKTPAPRDWRQASEALKSLTEKKKHAERTNGPVPRNGEQK